MIRGTTPTLLFTLPFDVNMIQVCSIAFAQNNKLVLEKQLEDCNITDKNTLSLKLTQEDTLLFKDSILTEIQLRVKTDSNDAIASNIIKVSTDKILKDGVI